MIILGRHSSLVQATNWSIKALTAAVAFAKALRGGRTIEGVDAVTCQALSQLAKHQLLVDLARGLHVPLVSPCCCPVQHVLTPVPLTLDWQWLRLQTGQSKR